MSKKDRKVTIRMTEEEKHPLNELAERFGVSTAFIIRRLLRAGIRDQSKHCLVLTDSDGQERTA